ncbi:MAG: hypothetical protein XD84_1295 [Desulfotomaculum sp. 46_80]|nr:MAG: hypothetical protein XD84_1295 [Desulfotomaculum sp. 46_80]
MIDNFAKIYQLAREKGPEKLVVLAPDAHQRKKYGTELRCLTICVQDFPVREKNLK